MLESDFKVWALSRKSAQECGFENKVQVLTGDICSSIYLPADIQCIYHCAGVIDDEKRMQAVNTEGTRRIVDLALKKGCRLVHLSSAGVVGRTRVNIIDETTPCLPGSLYERSKLEAEQIVFEGIIKGLQAQILRPTIIFGGMGRKPERDSFLQLIQAMLSGKYRQIGNGIYNIIHVEEVVRAMLVLSDDTLENGGTYFINTPFPYAEMFSIISRLSGSSEKAAKNLPYPVAWCAALLLSSMSMITGRPAPLTFSRLTALTNRKVFLQQRLEQLIGYRTLKSVEEYIEKAFWEYKKNNLI